MRIKVKVPFIDKYTKDLYKEGQEIEVTKARAEEIISRIPDYVEAVEEKKAVKKPAAKKTKKKED